MGSWLGRSGKCFHAHRDAHRHRDCDCHVYADRHACPDVHAFTDGNTYPGAHIKPYAEPTNATSHQDTRGGRDLSTGYADPDPDADLLAAYIYTNADADKYPQAQPGAASTNTHRTTAAPHRTTAATHRNALATRNAHSRASRGGASARRIEYETD